MPPTTKDRALYEQLRRHGASKQEASRRVKAAKRGRPPTEGQSGGLEHLTVFDLKVRAKERGLRGFSDKSRAELIEMLHDHREVPHD